MPETTPGRKVDVYQDAAGEWRWRRIAVANGQTVADSGEGYTRYGEAVHAAEREFPNDAVNVIDPDDAPPEDLPPGSPPIPTDA